MTVQKAKRIIHTAIKRDDFSELTVEKEKTFNSTVLFIVLH